VRLRTTAILRGLGAQRTADAAEQCWEIGMDLVEVPVQGAEGWASLEGVAARSAGRPFGAGTVLTPDDVRRAVDVGASVIISPGIDAEVVAAALDAGVMALPGVMTPTEVTTATALGLATCKLFPATVVGLGGLKALRGPFPEMAFVAVGGIEPGNAATFLAAGASGVAFGTSIEAVLALDDPAGWVADLHRHAATSWRRALSAM
jgi:2-dehydro-3-deoxyphosphogluconate aldolase / (4S)-4-hydroxy-2-oxoglutarate aldolase